MVNLNCQNLRFRLKTEEDHLEISKISALIFYNANTLLNIWKYMFDSNKLKIHHFGMATFQKNTKLIKATFS